MIFLTLLLLSHLSFSNESSTCFKDKLPFFSVAKRLNLPPKDKIIVLQKGCREAKKSNYYKEMAITERLAVGFAHIGFSSDQGLAAFSKLGGTQRQNDFKKELNEIKKVKNPVDRIKKVYELVALNQGEYDYENMKEYRLGTPGNLLNRRDREKSVGVCRDMAALLQWSLMQVSRHPSSKNHGLESTDFSSELKAGFIDGGGHVWVRVNLPNHDANGRLIDFTHFDIDTTWYPEQFSILFPRLSSLSDKNFTRLISECVQVIKCLHELSDKKPTKVQTNTKKRSAR